MCLSRRGEGRSLKKIIDLQSRTATRKREKQVLIERGISVFYVSYCKSLLFERKLSGKLLSYSRVEKL